MNVKEFLLSQVEKHPSDLVAVAMAHFKLTRPAVHEHLNRLIESGRIRKVGRRKGVRYFLTQGNTWKYRVSAPLEEDRVWEETIKSFAERHSENVFSILQYGTTEMINNVIDHSEAKQLILRFEEIGNKIRITVADDGIGIFKKIADAKALADPREAVLHLSKGKLTTDPKRHSGEGIFFTSRAFDRFMILSDELAYVRLNRDHDWFVETRKESAVKGTGIRMEINKNSPRRLANVFAEYQDPETHRFDKTNLFVKLARLEGEQYISRSQAKRLLIGMEKFKRINLDFANVKTVGQAFVDEVFRVFKNQHPDIEIDYTNAGSDVEFMIKRGIETSRE